MIRRGRDTVVCMGSVIWIKDATWDERWDDYAEEWHHDLAAKTDLQLVESLNREVGNNGWVSARAVFLKVLWDELHARGFDLSAVDELTRFPGERKFALRGVQLVMRPRPSADRDSSPSAAVADPWVGHPPWASIDGGRRPRSDEGIPQYTV